MPTTATSTGTLSVRLDRLFVPENVREIDKDFIAKLERSVKARGRIINPVEVIDADPTVHGDAYDHVLVAGFRRVEVARRLGFEEIPGFYGDAEDEHTDRAVENMVRTQLNPYEEAIAIKRILDTGKSEDHAAELLGLSKHLVTRRVKLLQLPELAQRLVGDGTLVLASVEPLLTIAQTNPVLLDVVIEYIAEHASELKADDLVYQPLRMVLYAAADTESDVFVAPIGEVPLSEPALLPQDESTVALIAEAADLYKQLHPYSYGHPRIRFTEAETDRARAAGVLLEHDEEDPLVTDFAVYRDLCRTAIATGVQAFKQQLSERAEIGDIKAATNNRKGTADEKFAALQTANRREIRQLAETAHSANLDLANTLRAGLTVIDPTDMNVARFFVYALLGADSENSYAKDTVVSAIALRGIRFVIGDFREDKTKTRKDGSPGALRISYGEGNRHENQSHWLWKYLDGARSAGELYGRALVVIAAEQYASRLVVPASQQIRPLTWPSHKNIALKALTKLAGPHIAPTLKALEKAVAKANREHKDAEDALLDDQRRERDAKRTRAKAPAAEDELPDQPDDDDPDSLDSDHSPHTEIAQLGTNIAPGVSMVVLDSPNSQSASRSIATPTSPDSTSSEAVDPADQADGAGSEDVLDASAEIDF
jgi:ParB/RepB/Spo0J family partition protein